MLPVEVHFSGPNFTPSKPQAFYAALVSDPTGPETLAKLADAVGVQPIEITEWFADPAFRDWLRWECENRFEMLLPLLWRELFGIALTPGTDAALKLEVVKVLATRFDKRMALMKTGANLAAKEFAKRLAEQKNKTIAVR